MQVPPQIFSDVRRAQWEFAPQRARYLGLHEFDGLLPDWSEDGLAARARIRSAQRRTLEALTDLDVRNEIDRRLLLIEFDKEALFYDELRDHVRLPLLAASAVSVVGYEAYDYAPLEERIRAATRQLEATPEFLYGLIDHWTNIAPSRVEASLIAFRGLKVAFDGPTGFWGGSAGDVATTRHFAFALEKARVSLDRAIRALENSHGRDDFALGPDNFAELLRISVGAPVDLAEMARWGWDDLDRNTEALKDDADRLGIAVDDISATLAQDTPDYEDLVPATRDTLSGLEKFVVEHDIIDMPDVDEPLVTDTPRFYRYTFASCHVPGPYEKHDFVTQYWVTPPDDDWDDARKDSWMGQFNNPELAIMSAHEVYPGHHVQLLRHREAKTDVALGHKNYDFIEGWAHYCEEMMIEEGYADGDPLLDAAMRVQALQRNVRYLTAIGLHVDDWTVEQAEDVFVRRGMLDSAPARSEAVRGAWDPSYYGYTLGKLQLMRLRDELRGTWGTEFSLHRFHEACMRHGSPPVAMLRELILDEEVNRGDPQQ